MSFAIIEILGLAVALGCDAFAVGLGVAARWNGPRQVFRLAFHFGLFQFIMPVLGWPLGRGALGVVSGLAPWLAFAVLVFLGGRMIKEGLSGQGEQFAGKDPTKGLSLVGLSLATSMDALGAGFSLGIMGGAVLFPAMVIGVVAALMTIAAMFMGKRLSATLGGKMDIAGGIILILIGVKVALF